MRSKSRFVGIAVAAALLLTAALAWPAPIYAGGHGNYHAPPTKATATAAAHAEFANVNQQQQGQLQGQLQGQHQGQEQSQTQTAHASVDGNNQSVTIQEAAPPSRISVRSAPGVYSPFVEATSPCLVARTAGGSWMGGGISVGGSVLDEECNLRETARAFAALGLTDHAVKILCDTKAARQALGTDCLKYSLPAPQEPADASAESVTSPVADSSRFVTREELAERDRRLTETLGAK